MSQASKSVYYKALKDAGVPIDKHYRDYTTDELKALHVQHGLPALVEPTPAAAAPPNNELAEIKGALNKLTDVVGFLVEERAKSAAVQPQPVLRPQPPVQPAPKPTTQGLDPMQHAGVTLNTHAEDEPIRVDPDGTIWYRNEVPKSGFPKPRGRRVLRTMEPGTKTEQIQVGEYIETFEVPDNNSSLQATEIKVTLPSYQTGLFRAPNMPFRIHTYQGNRAFDYDDINRYYGGADLVPDTIKRVYVSSDLCYDIQTTIRAIENEYRERVLGTGPLR